MFYLYLHYHSGGICCQDCTFQDT